jgi:hypothetical protein
VIGGWNFVICILPLHVIRNINLRTMRMDGLVACMSLYKVVVEILGGNIWTQMGECFLKWVLKELSGRV